VARPRSASWPHCLQSRVRGREALRQGAGGVSSACRPLTSLPSFARSLARAPVRAECCGAALSCLALPYLALPCGAQAWRPWIPGRSGLTCTLRATARVCRRPRPLPLPVPSVRLLGSCCPCRVALRVPGEHATRLLRRACCDAPAATRLPPATRPLLPRPRPASSLLCMRDDGRLVQVRQGARARGSVEGGRPGARRKAGAWQPTGPCWCGAVLGSSWTRRFASTWTPLASTWTPALPPRRPLSRTLLPPRRYAVLCIQAPSTSAGCGHAAATARAGQVAGIDRPDEV
jgi:hypothetical protein